MADLLSAPRMRSYSDSKMRSSAKRLNSVSASSPSSHDSTPPSSRLMSPKTSSSGRPSAGKVKQAMTLNDLYNFNPMRKSTGPSRTAQSSLEDRESSHRSSSQSQSHPHPRSAGRTARAPPMRIEVAPTYTRQLLAPGRGAHVLHDAIADIGLRLHTRLPTIREEFDPYAVTPFSLPIRLFATASGPDW